MINARGREICEIRNSQVFSWNCITSSRASRFNYSQTVKVCFRGYSNFGINIAFHKCPSRFYFTRKYSVGRTVFQIREDVVCFGVLVRRKIDPWNLNLSTRPSNPHSDIPTNRRNRLVSIYRQIPLLRSHG